MSYGSGRERKKVLRKFKNIDAKNIKDFLKLAADQYVSEYPKQVNDRASEKETSTDKDFLKAIASKNFGNAYSAYLSDVKRLSIKEILKQIMDQYMTVDYNAIPMDIRQFLGSEEARGMFFENSRAGIRKILQAPLQMGLSRTVLQKYLQ